MGSTSQNCNFVKIFIIYSQSWG